MQYLTCKLKLSGLLISITTIMTQNILSSGCSIITRTLFILRSSREQSQLEIHPLPQFCPLANDRLFIITMSRPGILTPLLSHVSLSLTYYPSRVNIPRLFPTPKFHYPSTTPSFCGIQWKQKLPASSISQLKVSNHLLYFLACTKLDASGRTTCEFPS